MEGRLAGDGMGRIESLTQSCGFILRTMWSHGRDLDYKEWHDKSSECCKCPGRTMWKWQEHVYSQKAVVEQGGQERFCR